MLYYRTRNIVMTITDNRFLEQYTFAIQRKVVRLYGQNENGVGQDDDKHEQPK